MTRSTASPWWYRPPPRAAEQRLTRRRLYILPSRNGVLLALVLLAMLVGAMNYSNGLAYALTFLLTSVAVVSLLHTYRNLVGLTLRAGQCRPVFVGETASFPVAVENPGAARFAIALELENGRAVTDLAARGLHWIELRRPATARGWCELPRVTAATTFPLGLFRAWSYVELEQRCLVYPRPEESPPPPPTGGGHEGARAEGRRGEGRDDFAHLRDYRAGDSLRHVHWKALAREQGLLTKEFEGGGGRDLWLDWGATGVVTTEARLSRLCRWVLMADAAGRRYGLQLPGRRVEPGAGTAHRRRCLEALALFGSGP